MGRQVASKPSLVDIESNQVKSEINNHQLLPLPKSHLSPIITISYQVPPFISSFSQLSPRIPQKVAACLIRPTRR